MITEMVGQDDKQQEYTPAAASAEPATPAASPAAELRGGADAVVTKTRADQNQE
jgi:hypothetical protein